MGLVKIWDKEIKGKVYAVGDIHGCYNLLMSNLKKIGFDYENDLLVAVGDLVDRGVQNEECITLMDEPWFTSIMGNHEELCIRSRENQAIFKCHFEHGGAWFYELDILFQQEIINKLKTMPIVLELDYNGKTFGFVHGHIEENDWDEFKQSFENPSIRGANQLAMWNRDRLDMDNKKFTHVSGVDAVIMGHTVTREIFKRDNCYFIDTGAVHWGTITIIDLSKI